MTDAVRVGDTIRFFYGKDNRNNRTIHIRAIVDDDQIVFRWWSRKKQTWIYQVEDAIYFEISREHWAKVGTK